MTNQSIIPTAIAAPGALTLAGVPCVSRLPRVPRVPSARRHLSALIGSLLLLTSGAVSADVYKWVDERGVVNYSDSAPQGRSAHKMDRTMNRLMVVPPSPDSTARAARLADDLMRARVDRDHREQVARWMEHSTRQDTREGALLHSWRQRCIAEQWADCDHAPTLFNRYAEFPYHVPLWNSRVTPPPVALPLPPRAEAPRIEPPRPAAIPERPAKPAARRADR